MEQSEEGHFVLYYSGCQNLAKDRISSVGCPKSVGEGGCAAHYALWIL